MRLHLQISNGNLDIQWISTDIQWISTDIQNFMGIHHDQCNLGGHRDLIQQPNFMGPPIGANDAPK